MENRLDGETSPYLLQHADNPVAWHPWDEQALALARDNDLPILLSIGYSACHWCHVMAHESFADHATAEVMNQHFINIKVDREERPDLDKVYQTALQLLTQQTGGWPLTMFLDPQTLLPFYGGTYFPKAPRYQLPAFKDLLLRVSEIYTTQRQDLQDQGSKMADVLAALHGTDLASTLDDTALLQAAREQLGSQYDGQHGGFGNAPKFPMVGAIERILRHWAMQRRQGGNDKDALDMVMITLTQIARGGIYDHLGGGFCRYATDRQWMIPHFEKMLYDNAQLLTLYSDALRFGTDALFEDAISETVAWLEREMRDPAGGFYAAQDADSEGEEGKYYVWRRDEVKKLLSASEYLIVETLYGLDKPANFEGRWNLHRFDSWRSVVARLSLNADEALESLRSAKQKLLRARRDRPAPATDQKIITAWNGLLIKGLVTAADQLKRQDWLVMAQGCADFVRRQCFKDGRLYATWTAGQPRHNGYLDDYVNVLDGLLSLLSVEWRDSDALFAKTLADILVEQFYDHDNGGFFFTADDHERLIHRPKPTMDDALPPGNGVAAQTLMQLGHLLGETRYLDAAHNTLSWARGMMERYPAGHCTLMHALEESVYSNQQVVLRGPREAMQSWLDQLDTTYAPWRRCYAIPYEEVTLIPSYLPRLVSAAERDQVTAYVCSGMSCSLPLRNLEALKSALD